MYLSLAKPLPDNTPNICSSFNTYTSLKMILQHSAQNCCKVAENFSSEPWSAMPYFSCMSYTHISISKQVNMNLLQLAKKSPHTSYRCRWLIPGWLVRYIVCKIGDCQKKYFRLAFLTVQVKLLFFSVV